MCVITIDVCVCVTATITITSKLLLLLLVTITINACVTLGRPAANIPATQNFRLAIIVFCICHTLYNVISQTYDLDI